MSENKNTYNKLIDMLNNKLKERKPMVYDFGIWTPHAVKQFDDAIKKVLNNEPNPEVGDTTDAK